MKFEVELTNKASRDLRRIHRGDRNAFKAISAALLGFVDDPYPPGHLRLRGRDGYRIRVGDYRILYDVQQDRVVVEVFRIASRGQVYKGI